MRRRNPGLIHREADYFVWWKPEPSHQLWLVAGVNLS
jgi:hypothetical protein